MNTEQALRGGAPVGALASIAAWQASLILNLRLWCDGTRGQQQVCADYHNTFPQDRARQEIALFQELIATLMQHAHRPLVRHQVCCSCVGSDECVFAHMVGTASAGQINDAAMVATLLVNAAQAEHLAILAGQVGQCARKMTDPAHHVHDDVPRSGTVVRLQ
ncbi:hypothetical protein [Actibacterium sp. 188UL27-1]|uniref:hypothetical protein n=1 Tax=Actibacterium sp. 188UL27-1 TaxID=2786961 RepID=UPI00195CE1B0|nr:hypothetical protein [Actibacterium sp. 188UL27-1]MBM7067253.1 hypothetical protein [Actibacterium sp. 188UL27-1]